MVKLPFRLANSQSTGTVVTLSGVSSIHAGTNVATLSGKSSIHAGTSVVSVSGRSNIHSVSSVATISGKSSLKVKSNLDLGPLQSSGFDLGPLQSPPVITTIQPISGVTFIHPAHSVLSLSGVSHIQAVHTVETISGRAHLISAGISLKTILGISSILADTVPPSSPGSLASVQSGACVVLTWTAATAVTFISSYTVWRCGGVGCTVSSPIATVSGTTLTYTDCSVTSGSYTYQVTATNGSGVPGPPSTNSTILVLLTTVVPISGISHIQGGAVKTISGVSNIVSATPSLGVRVTQLPMIVTRHPIQAADGSGNTINVSQVALIAGRKPTQLDVRVSQVLLIVRMPYLGRFSYGFSGDNYGIGT